MVRRKGQNGGKKGKNVEGIREIHTGLVSKIKVKRGREEEREYFCVTE